MANDQTNSNVPGDQFSIAVDTGGSQIDKLNFAESRLKIHHNAIWEEEKHFTWLNSLLLSAIIYLLTTDKVSDQLRLITAIAVSLFGAVISMIALMALRKESIFFRTAHELYVREFNGVFPERQIPIPDPNCPNKSLRSLLKSFLDGTLGVRDAFQMIFLVFIIGFAIILVLCFIFLILQFIHSRGSSSAPISPDEWGTIYLFL